MDMPNRLGQSQNDLLNTHRRLARAERRAALGALAARLAHELGTPLHSIAGHLDLLLAEPELPAAARERTEIIAGEVDRLCTLIRSQLKRLRPPQPERADADVNALVGRIAELMRPVLDARGIALVVELDPAAAGPFACDATQVEQVLLNLVQNALDAMAEGGRLVLRTQATGNGRTLSVCDTGCGIPEEVIDRVFEPFFTTKEPGQGTGLGLTLCREIARNHGGEVVLDSQPSLGTVVTVTLSEP